MAQGPIGIFDSGIGGLTIASAIKAAHPDTSIIYFGDTAHLPYGDKSAKLIQGYIKSISNFLYSQGCSSIVVACNSASSVLQPGLLKDSFDVVVNVIDPVVQKVAESTSSRRVGVIGTRRTINSHVYKQRLNLLSPDLEVIELATPLLAPMIEDGFIKNSIARSVIDEYLGKLGSVDTLILGCTHYPLIKKEIEEYYSGQVELIDAPELIAQQLTARSFPTTPTDRFFVSDYTESFELTARLFFGSAIHLEEKKIH